MLSGGLHPGSGRGLPAHLHTGGVGSGLEEVL